MSLSGVVDDFILFDRYRVGAEASIKALIKKCYPIAIAQTEEMQRQATELGITEAEVFGTQAKNPETDAPNTGNENALQMVTEPDRKGQRNLLGDTFSSIVSAIKDPAKAFQGGGGRGAEQVGVPLRQPFFGPVGGRFGGVRGIAF